MDSLKRAGAPLWPKSKGNYENLSSQEDLPLHSSSSNKFLLDSRSPPFTQAYTPSEGVTPVMAPYSSTFEPTEEPTERSRDTIQGKEKSPWFGYGWRGGARIAFFGAITVLIINSAILAWMGTAYEYMDGMPVIFRGTCEEAEFKNRAIHLVVNSLSTVMLAASNYCMQLLSAPNRRNISKAHSGGYWLDIGIPSIRNLRFLSLKRRVLWFCLALTSIPLHLVYNSTFYTAIATNNYNILYATEDFVQGGPYDTSKFSDSRAQNISDFQARARNWTRLNNTECIQQYAHDFITEYRNVVAVVKNVSSTNTLLEVLVNELPPNGELGHGYNGYAWLCNDTETEDRTNIHEVNAAGYVPCHTMVDSLQKMASTWWKSGGFSIDHCLAEEIVPDCHLHFAPQLMGPVVFFNLVKTVVIFYVAFRLIDRPLVTLGDAIESFIVTPDPTTEGMCLASSKDIETNWARGYAPAPLRYVIHHLRWRRIVTTRQWSTLFTFFGTAFIALMIGVVISTRDQTPATLAAAWDLGLGNVRTQNLILHWKLPQLGTYAVLLSALVANSAQVAFSILYIVYNTILTTMCVGEGWDRFAGTRHGTHRFLRVSDPRGNQKNTYFLTLPYRYALPLIILSGLSHWLLSQTLFLANISVIPRDGTLPRQDEITTCAYSPQGMIWLIVVILLMAAFLMGNAARRYTGTMSMVGCNSAAISAACHVVVSGGREEREKMVTRKLAWGDVTDASDMTRKSHKSGLGITEVRADSSEDDVTSYDHRSSVLDRIQENTAYESPRVGGDGGAPNVGHCSFSDGILQKPTQGKLYA